MSDKKPKENSCQTINRGRGRPRLFSGASERFTFRLRRGSEYDEILAVLDSLPDRAKSAWIIHALRCYVRGEIRDVEKETREISAETGEALWSMFREDGDVQDG